MQTNILPHSEEAEKALLGAIVLQPKKIFEAIESRLSPEDFYFPKHQAIFRAMLDVQARNLPIDPIQLSAELKGKSEIDSCMGLVTLAEECYRLESSSNYAKIVREKAIFRQFFETFRSLSKQALESTDLEQFIRVAQAAFLDSMPERLQRDGKSLVDSMGEYMLRVEAMGAGKAELGFMTGFRDFDALTKGFRKGQLIIMAGRPGTGKSALSTSIVLNRLRMEEASSIFIFSLEMTEDEIAERAFAGLARIDGDVLKGGNLQPKHWSSLTSAHELASKNSKVTICWLPILPLPRSLQSANRSSSRTRPWTW